MRQECRERFPATAGWRSRHASRHVREAQFYASVERPLVLIWRYWNAYVSAYLQGLNSTFRHAVFFGGLPQQQDVVDVDFLHQGSTFFLKARDLQSLGGTQHFGSIFAWQVDLLKTDGIFNTLMSWQNGRYFADDIFKVFFLDENCCIFIQISPDHWNLFQLRVQSTVWQHWFR